MLCNFQHPPGSGRLRSFIASLWSRDIETEVIPVLDELGIGLVPYAPLGRGFLTGKITSFDDLAPNDFRRISPRFQGGNLASNQLLVDRVKAIAADRGVTTAQVALAWVLKSAPGCVPIPGTTKPERIEENAAALGIELAGDDIRSLNETFEPGAVAGTRWPAPMMATLNG